MARHVIVAMAAEDAGAVIEQQDALAFFAEAVNTSHVYAVGVVTKVVI